MPHSPKAKNALPEAGAEPREGEGTGEALSPLPGVCSPGAASFLPSLLSSATAGLGTTGSRAAIRSGWPRPERPSTAEICKCKQ